MWNYCIAFFLSKHPKIIGSVPKEIDYFNSEVKYDRGLNYYHSYFTSKPFFAKLRGYKYLESSPSYISDLTPDITAQRIYEYNNNIKIISLVRNPAIRAYSAWQMYKKRYEDGDTDWWIDWVKTRRGKLPKNLIRRNAEEYQDFESFIKNEINAIAGNKTIECNVLKHGHYYSGIQSYQTIFKNNFITLKNENVNKNTSIELKKLGSFLDLDDFNWSIFDDIKVFKGDYKYSPNKETLNLLNEYYHNSNKILKETTGISYL